MCVQGGHQAPAGPSPLRGRSNRQSGPPASVAPVPSSLTTVLAATGEGGFMVGTGPSTFLAAVTTAAGAVSVVDARCEHPGCWRDAVFAGHADPGRLPRFCHVHRSVCKSPVNKGLWQKCFIFVVHFICFFSCRIGDGALGSTLTLYLLPY